MNTNLKLYQNKQSQKKRNIGISQKYNISAGISVNPDFNPSEFKSPIELDNRGYHFDLTNSEICELVTKITIINESYRDWLDQKHYWTTLNKSDYDFKFEELSQDDYFQYFDSIWHKNGKKSDKRLFMERLYKFCKYAVDRFIRTDVIDLQFTTTLKDFQYRFGIITYDEWLNGSQRRSRPSQKLGLQSECKERTINECRRDTSQVTLYPPIIKGMKDSNNQRMISVRNGFEKYNFIHCIDHTFVFGQKKGKNYGNIFRINIEQCKAFVEWYRRNFEHEIVDRESDTVELKLLTDSSIENLHLIKEKDYKRITFTDRQCEDSSKRWIKLEGYQPYMAENLNKEIEDIMELNGNRPHKLLKQLSKINGLKYQVHGKVRKGKGGYYLIAVTARPYSRLCLTRKEERKPWKKDNGMELREKVCEELNLIELPGCDMTASIHNLNCMMQKGFTFNERGLDYYYELYKEVVGEESAISLEEFKNSKYLRAGIKLLGNKSIFCKSENDFVKSCIRSLTNLTHKTPNGGEVVGCKTIDKVTQIVEMQEETLKDYFRKYWKAAIKLRGESVGEYNFIAESIVELITMTVYKSYDFKCEYLYDSIFVDRDKHDVKLLNEVRNYVILNYKTLSNEESLNIEKLKGARAPLMAGLKTVNTGSLICKPGSQDIVDKCQETFNVAIIKGMSSLETKHQKTDGYPASKVRDLTDFLPDLDETDEEKVEEVKPKPIRNTRSQLEALENFNLKDFMKSLMG